MLEIMLGIPDLASALDSIFIRMNKQDTSVKDLENRRDHWKVVNAFNRLAVGDRTVTDFYRLVILILILDMPGPAFDVRCSCGSCLFSYHPTLRSSLRPEADNFYRRTHQGTIIDRRARVEFFFQRKVLQTCPIPYPACSDGHRLYWMKRGSLQFDSSSKGGSKKMAYQVRLFFVIV